MRELRLEFVETEGRVLVDPSVVEAIHWALNVKDSSLQFLPKLRTLSFEERAAQNASTLFQLLSRSIRSLQITFELTNFLDVYKLGMRSVLESLPFKCPSLCHLSLCYHRDITPDALIKSFDISIPSIKSLTCLRLSNFQIRPQQFITLTNLPELYVVEFSIDSLKCIPPGTLLHSVRECRLWGQALHSEHLCIIDSITTRQLVSISIDTKESMSSEIVQDVLTRLRSTNLRRISLLWSGPQYASATLSSSVDHIRPDMLLPLLGFHLLEIFEINISASFEYIDDDFIGQIATSCSNLETFDLATKGLNHKTKVTLKGLVDLCRLCRNLKTLGLYFDIEGIENWSVASPPQNTSITHLAVGFTMIPQTSHIQMLADFIIALLPKLKHVSFGVDVWGDYSGIDDFRNEPYLRWNDVIDIIRGRSHYYEAYL